MINDAVQEENFQLAADLEENKIAIEKQINDLTQKQIMQKLMKVFQYQKKKKIKQRMKQLRMKVFYFLTIVLQLKRKSLLPTDEAIEEESALSNDETVEEESKRIPQRSR